MDEALKQIERFHGHLGPYAVIGYKMGEIAKQILGPDSFSKKVIVWTGIKPPISCIIDGIQISSGCTLGKGNISVNFDGVPKARFSNNDGKHVEIVLKTGIQEEIDTTVTGKNIIHYSEQIYQRPNQELFDIA